MLNDEAFNYEGSINVPESRIGAVIGKRGSTKRMLERKLNAQLEIEGNSVHFSTKDPVHFMKIRDVIKAIARGFTPEEALMLLNDEYVLDIINLEEVFGKNENTISRYKARVIGRQGTVRKKIEEETNTKIVIYGKTISLIGKGEDVSIALEVIDSLLRGAKHSTAFKILNKLKTGKVRSLRK